MRLLSSGTLFSYSSYANIYGSHICHDCIPGMLQYDHTQREWYLLVVGASCVWQISATAMTLISSFRHSAVLTPDDHPRFAGVYPTDMNETYLYCSGF